MHTLFSLLPCLDLCVLILRPAFSCHACGPCHATGVRSSVVGGYACCKVVYLPYVAVEYVQWFSATNQLVPYLKDSSESRRLGTLLVSCW